MARVRDAAAVMLTRGTGPDPEVCLVLRSKRLRFFGGYWAFPGGVLDERDGFDAPADEALLRRRCALRELFEETGVLAAPLGEVLGPEAREEVRQGLLDGDEASFARWVEALRSRPRSVDALRPLGRLTTPSFAPVRYATDFFQLELPAGEAPRVVPGELDEGGFMRASEVLREWRAGQSAVVPPILFLLGERVEREEDEFERAWARRLEELAAGELHPVFFSPGIQVAPLRTETIPPATTTNCLLVGGENVYVVDPASRDPDEQARLTRLLEGVVADGRRVAGVLLTHHHPDHVGGVAAVAGRFATPVFAHTETLRRLSLGDVEVRGVRAGDTFDLGAAPDGTAPWTLEAVFTPGHSPGHLVFVESRYGSIAAGDLVSTISTIVIDPPEGHLATYLRSLRSLLDRPKGVIHPAHGPAHRDSHELVRHYLAHRREREERLRGALRDAPRPVSELLVEVYDDVDERLLPVAARSLEAGLIKLEEEGRARREGAAWTACGRR